MKVPSAIAEICAYVYIVRFLHLVLTIVLVCCLTFCRGQPSAAKKEEMKEMEEEALNCTTVCSSPEDIVGAIPEDVQIPEMLNKKKFMLKKKQK